MIPLTSSISVLLPVSSHRARGFLIPTTNSFLSGSLAKESRCCKSRFGTLYFNSVSSKEKAHSLGRPASSSSGEDNAEEEFQVVTALRSNYNEIVILDTPQSRVLLLDSTHNVHSICNKGRKWTGSYWDEFASLPAIVPQGPIAILGLGGGTAAHLMLDVWPSLVLEGWEIDEILIDKARECFGLSDLEKRRPGGGILHVRIGDALSPSVNIAGGYAGIVVDLFSEGKVLPQLQEIATWLELNDKLMPDGRLMVNCGAATDGVSDKIGLEVSSIDGTWVQNSTIKALCKAFPGQLNWKKMPKEEGENYLALTGPLPDLTKWSAVLPEQLSVNVQQWRPCSPL